MALVVPNPNPDRDSRPAADSDPDTAAAAEEPTAAASRTVNIGTRSKRTATPTDALLEPAAVAAASALAATTAPWRMDVGRSISAAVLAGFRSPAIEAVRQLQLGITEQLRAPIAIAPITTMVERALGPASWMGKQDSLWRAAMGPAWSFPAVFPTEPWWTETTLWPTDGLVASLLRPLDVVRPRLPDLSRTMDNLLGATSWIDQFNEGLWRGLRDVGQRVTFWAVLGARAALERGDMKALEDFVRDWCGTAPTPPRMEALVEALLQIDLERYAPHEGRQLLRDLRRRVKQLHAQRRAEHETLLGMRRGAGPIARLGNIDLTAFRLPGLPGPVSLEDYVLDRVQPDVDPRMVEKIKTLPPEDQKIVVIKEITDCSWSAAATACGRPARHGEAVRRRTHRWREQLAPSTDPWADLSAVADAQRDSFGRIQPATILAGITDCMTNVAVDVQS